jgi:serine-type D-Ala-D-Ala carboxypeptidase/endopeptidase (penicillin-binding protein 4)
VPARVCGEGAVSLDGMTCRLAIACCVALLSGWCPAAPRAYPLAAQRNGALPPAVVQAIAASGLPPRSFGLFAQAVVGERTVFALNADEPYTMASTTKIVTSLAALDLLGPHYRWHTSAYALGTLAEGKLVGDLLIVGGGNAQLTSSGLGAWFARMQAQGLREIDGDIVLDREAFRLTPADHKGTPLQSTTEPRHVWPDAMTLDEGVVELVVQPGRGARTAVTLKPVLSEVDLVNRLKPGPACAVEPQWHGGAEGRASVVVRGTWNAGCGGRTVQFVPPPESGIAARALPALWAAAGGVLRGRVVAAPGGPGANAVPREADGQLAQPMSFDRSKPLSELVRDINKASDNVGARNLMLSLSPGFPEQPATLAGAQKTIGLWLRDQGLAEGDIEVENGSGLSHTERARPRAMVQLLRKAWRAEQA